MQQVNMREVRQNISRLIDAVESGEKVIITRRGKPVAKLLIIDREEAELSFPDRRIFRAQLPPSGMSGIDLVQKLRDERG